MSLKIVSWNVNSIRKGIFPELNSLVKNHSPDIICFQETKTTEVDAKTFLHSNRDEYKELISTYPYKYWNDSKRGHAGTSVWCKHKPKSVSKSICGMEVMSKGRVIIVEFENCKVLNTYVPNTGRGEIADNERNEWHDGIVSFISEMPKDKLFVWCGDLNVVDEPSMDTTKHKAIPKQKIAGLKQYEKDHFDQYIEMGLIDSFRHLYPDKRSYTWFSPMRDDVRWRIDYFLVNDKEKIKNVIHGEKLLSTVSDHTWIILEVTTDMEVTAQV